MVRNGNSYVQMGLYATPASACGDKKLYEKKIVTSMVGGREGRKTACLKATTCQDS